MSENFGPGLMGGVVLVDPISGQPYKAADFSVADLTNPATPAGASLSSTYVTRADADHNIVDPQFGVTRGTAATQTAAIRAALDAHPGEAFYFPLGDYRLDTSLVVTSGNSLILAPGARIYAAAAMDKLIDYDNGAGSASSYANDKAIMGQGLLDANLLAGSALEIGSVIRFTLEGVAIKDPLKRGLVAKASGAELIARNLRIYNTGTTNAADNIGIEATMGDSHFTDIIIQDFTQGIWDKGNNTWTNVHPWIGTTAQLTARYPASVAFTLSSNSVLVTPFADTFRYSFRSAAASGYAKTEIVSPRFFCNTGNLTNALAAANPGAVFDMVDGGQMFVRGGKFTGHGVTAYAFVQGATARFNARESIDIVPTSVSGVAEYRRGVKMGTSTFVSAPFGSTSGNGVWTTNTCHMEVRDGSVQYRFLLVGTLSAGFAGKLRIGGIPMPPGATVVGSGVGGVSYVTGPDINTIIGANGTAAPLVALLQKVGGGTTVEPDSTALAGTAVQVWGQITCPFTYPS